jgi:dTDP-4-amino-4,6-dideoxygalactose transaminase
MSVLKEISEYYNIPIIEDACQSIGATYYNKKAGAIGDIGCFSFYPSKNLGGYGDSGMVVTNDVDLADKMRILRNHGQKPKYYNHFVGGNFRMDEIQAAVLRVKLNYLEKWIDDRRRHAKIYNDYFKGRKTPISTPVEFEGCRHTYHLYLIRSTKRDLIAKTLRKKSIGCDIYYPLPLHLQPCFEMLGHIRGDFPMSEMCSDTNLAIPVYPEIPDEDIEMIASIIHDAVIIK